MLCPCFRFCGNVAMTTAARLFQCKNAQLHFSYNTTIFCLALDGKLQNYWVFCIQVLLNVLGHCVDGAQKASVVLTSSCTQRGCVGGGAAATPSHICVVWSVFSGCSSSLYLQPPPPPALVDKTPTLPTADSNSAPRLHGYAGLLSKIKTT